MPYYVCAIHTDSTVNRLYHTFDNFKDAEKLEAEMRSGNYPGDNYFVQMIYAENDSDLEEIIDSIRKDRNLPTTNKI